MGKSAVQITKESYNKIARDYVRRKDKNFIWNIISVMLCKKFLKHLPKRKCRILVAGSTGGHTTLYMAKKSPHYLIGVDFSEELVKISNEKKKEQGVKNCKFEVRDLIDMKIQGKFDGIFSDGVLYHIPRDKLIPLLNKFNKALTDDGFFYSNFKRGKGFELQQNPHSYPGHPRAYWFYTPDELRVIFSKAGFDTVIKAPIIRLRGESYIEVFARHKKRSQ